MSAKNCDQEGRFRNLTIAFHVSPEENDSINMRVRLSGLTKQEYISRRCQQQDIVVVGNPRVYKALKTQLEQVYTELLRINSKTEMNSSMRETIRILAVTVADLNNESRR